MIPSAEFRGKFEQFARNGRWGTCISCPKSAGAVYPEFCEHTGRYDHQLSLKGLVEQYCRWVEENSK